MMDDHDLEAVNQVNIDKSVFHKYIHADSQTKQSIDSLLPDLLSKTMMDFFQNETVQTFEQGQTMVEHFVATGILDRNPTLDVPLFKLFRRVNLSDFTNVKTFFRDNPQLMTTYLKPFARVLNLPPPERAQLIDNLKTENTPLRFNQNERYGLGELLEKHVSIRNAQEAGLVGPSRVHPSRIPDIETILPFDFDSSASKLPLLYDNTTKDAFLPKTKIKSCLEIAKKKRRTVGFADSIVYIAHNTFSAEIECQLISLYGKHNKPTALEFIHSTSVNKTYKDSTLSDIKKYIEVMKPSIRHINFNLTDQWRFKRHVDDMQIVQALHDENEQQIFTFQTGAVISDALNDKFMSILKDLNTATKSNTFAFAKARSPGKVDVPPEFIYLFHGLLPPLEFFQQSFAYEEKDAQDQIIATRPRYNINIILYTRRFNQYFFPREEKTPQRMLAMVTAMQNDQEVKNTMRSLMNLMSNNLQTSFLIGFSNLPVMSDTMYVPPIAMIHAYIVTSYKPPKNILVTAMHIKKRPHLVLQRVS